MTEPSQNRRDMGEWDSVFEDSDPTRVLDPRTFGQEAESRQVSQSTDTGVSATRYQRTPPGQTYQRTAADVGQVNVPPVYPVEPVAPAQPLDAVRAPVSPVATPVSASPTTALKRVQFIPAFCGALVAYALTSGSLTLARTVMGLLGVSTYSGLTEAVLAVTAPASRAQALPWLITTAILFVIAFGLAGYAASRMTALAPSKQAVGVLAISTLGTLVATLLTWATVNLTNPIAPAYALQPLLAPDLAIGALTALAAGVLALVGALVGAGLGTRYHRALTSTDASLHPAG